MRENLRGLGAALAPAVAVGLSLWADRAVMGIYLLGLGISAPVLCLSWPRSRPRRASRPLGEK